VIVDNKKDILRQKLLAFEFGAKLQVDRAYSTYGGGAANAAVALSLLGFKAAACVAVGNDNRGLSIINNFKNRGVNTTLVQTCVGANSGFSFLLAGPQNEHVVFSYRAANEKLKISETEFNNFKQTEWIYLTSLSGDWQTALNKIFSLTKIKIAWNPGHIQLHSGIKTLGKYLKKTEVLIVNKDEALELVVSSGKYHNNDKVLNKIKNLLKVIKEWGPEIVVITNGKYGADVFDGRNFYHQNIIKEKERINTTGVGDAFGSTFTAGLKMFAGDIRKAMFAGVCNSASVVGAMGAQAGLLKKNEIIKKIAENKK
jgi:sugar/nucleoside kinase (ribokinase family)